jgi:hypothetical protein
VPVDVVQRHLADAGLRAAPQPGFVQAIARDRETFELLRELHGAVKQWPWRSRSFFDGTLPCYRGRASRHRYAAALHWSRNTWTLILRRKFRSTSSPKLPI